MSTAEKLAASLKRLETFGVRLGLETTRRLLTALGEPQRDLRAVLVAGTNGKGSTAALLTAMATAAGYRTGLYTSPHLESVEERIRIDGTAISTESLAEAVVTVVAVTERVLGYPPTYFEALTAAAFETFRRQAVELAVLEVGLGGRLDATNGAQPMLSLITEIGLEHQRHLGDTLASIAREKAGILRPGNPAIAWVDRAEARRAIAEVAEEVSAGLSWGPDEVSIESSTPEPGSRGQRVVLRTGRGEHRLILPLMGEHQAENLALAVLAAESLAAAGLQRLDRAAIARGVAGVRWPGRLEWIELPAHKPVLLDVAHNPDGARIVGRELARREDGYTLLFGSLADKEVGQILPPLAAGAVEVVLTRPPSDRALSPSELTPWLSSDSVVIEPDVGKALTSALAGQGDYVLVCGSVYLVGEVRAMLRERFGVPAPATETLFTAGPVDEPDSAG